MAAKKIIDEIKDAIVKKKTVIGTSSTIKKLKLGKIAKVYVSNNCPKSVVEEIMRCSKAANVPVENIDKSNEELGIVCKKTFSISVLSVLGETKKK